jgi:hypothetical protein
VPRQWVFATLATRCAHNPISQRNDCGLKCLEYILKKKLNTHTIRKDFEIAPNGVLHRTHAACCPANHPPRTRAPTAHSEGWEGSRVG